MMTLRSCAPIALAALIIGCAPEESRGGHGPGATLARDAAATANATASHGRPWTFAVLSDLHVPRDGHITPSLRHAVSAVLESQPRFVVITGDFTDGMPIDPPWRRLQAPRWWHAVRDLVTPIRAAGIPILPVAGNHDSYLSIYREDYAEAWRDLGAWAQPLRIHGKHQPQSGVALDAAPFSYSVEIDGVHLTLAHVVDQSLDRAVARWLARDLDAASTARLKIVFGHVPLASVATGAKRSFIETFGRILSTGHADVYVAGHEHLVWDEDVWLPGGQRIEQVIVGTTSAQWRFGPGIAAREQAACREEGHFACCTMPRTTTPFELQLDHGTWYEAQRHSFTLFTVDGTRIVARPIAIRDDGATEPFGRSTPCWRGPR